MDQLHAYLVKIADQLLPKSEAGKAVSYILKNWRALTRYLEDGDLAIDNNHTERSLRGLAIGRNNWTFLGSDRGGKTMAILRGNPGQYTRIPSFQADSGKPPPALYPDKVRSGLQSRGDLWNRGTSDPAISARGARGQCLWHSGLALVKVVARA
jgi:hypothetical protein